MTIVEREANPEIIAAQELEEAAHFLDLEPWIAQRLHHAERELHFNLQIRADDGHPVMLQAVRVQHSSVRGPGMGPLVFAKDQGATEVKVRAMEQTWQWALWGLPFGGSAGLVGADVNELSERELRQAVTAVAQVGTDFLGAAKDVLTPSRALPAQVMAWALAGFRQTDRESMGAITGKPISLQGVKREHIAALFLRELVREVLRERGSELAGRQVLLIGFDALARMVAAELQMAGAHVVGVVDSSAAIYSRAGLNVSMLNQHAEKEGVIYGFNEAEQVAFDELIKMPCDVLVLADGEELQIAPAAEVLIEAGGRVAELASGKGLVVPAILGEFGFSLADYFEWRKASGIICSQAEIRRLVRETCRGTFEFSREHDLPLGRAATTLAISRVGEAMRAG
jgi:glutamate dehydrogenase (NAD(P)+)